MIRSRFSLLGVLLAAIGLMAIFASAAQAEGHWLVVKSAGVHYTGEELSNLSEAAFEVESLENKTGSLLSEIGTTKISILCTALSLNDALMNATGGVKTGASVQFTGCKFLSGGTDGLMTEQPKCVPKTNGGPNGTVKTLPAHALLKLHNGEDTLLILPDVGDLATELELGASCAFGEFLPIFGHLALQDCGGTTKALELRTSHLVVEFAPLTTLALFNLRGQVGAKNAKIDGSANIKIVKGAAWAGIPE